MNPESDRRPLTKIIQGLPSRCRCGFFLNLVHLNPGVPLVVIKVILGSQLTKLKKVEVALQFDEQVQDHFNSPFICLERCDWALTVSLTVACVRTHCRMISIRRLLLSHECSGLCHLKTQSHVCACTFGVYSSISDFDDQNGQVQQKYLWIMLDFCHELHSAHRQESRRVLGQSI